MVCFYHDVSALTDKGGERRAYLTDSPCISSARCFGLGSLGVGVHLPKRIDGRETLADAMEGVEQRDDLRSL